jgi:sarcosine oxidase/L-pipecolate oxidase
MERGNGEAPEPVSYLIVGAGVFGLSTALHLARTRPEASVVVLDRGDVPNPASASWDLNKIIRADYRDPFYMKLALEACAAWDADPLYAPHFHQSGMVFAENEGKCDAMLRNLAALDPADFCVGSGSSSDNDDSDDCGSRETPAAATPLPPVAAARLLSVGDARAAFASLAAMNLQGAQRVYLNPQSGWADAAPALRDVAREAGERGVVFRRAEVAKLLLSDERAGRVAKRSAAAAGGLSCRGVRTNDGVDIIAERVLVCAGAYTAKLLADSGPREPALQAGDRLVAAAALSCTVRVLDPKKRVMHRNGPVVANEMPHTAGEFCLPHRDWAGARKGANVECSGVYSA